MRILFVLPLTRPSSIGQPASVLAHLEEDKVDMGIFFVSTTTRYTNSETNSDATTASWLSGEDGGILLVVLVVRNEMCCPNVVLVPANFLCNRSAFGDNDARIAFPLNKSVHCKVASNTNFVVTCERSKWAVGGEPAATITFIYVIFALTVSPHPPITKCNALAPPPHILPSLPVPQSLQDTK